MIRAVLLALALVATPAFADPPAEELTAAPGSIAIGMIEAANADGVFEIVHNGQVSVWHPASGLRCDFERDGEGGRIVLFAEFARGDNVACDQHDDSVAVTIYATRYPAPTTLQNQIEIANEAILYRFADAAPFESANTGDASSLSPARHVRYIATWNGERSLTRASVAIIGDWVFKMRYTQHAPDDAAAHEADSAATLFFTYTLSQIAAPGNL